MLLGIGKQRIRRLKKAIDAGLTSVPLDGRSAGNGAAARWELGRDAWLAIDCYLMHIYEYMAEPLAETDQDSEGDNSEGEDNKDSMDLVDDESIVSHASVGLGKRLPRKWIGHCRKSQMFSRVHLLALRPQGGRTSQPVHLHASLEEALVGGDPHSSFTSAREMRRVRPAGSNEVQG